MSFNPDKSHILTFSLRKDHLANSPIYFLNNPLQESFKLLGLTIRHDLSWAKYLLPGTLGHTNLLGVTRWNNFAVELQNLDFGILINTSQNKVTVTLW